MVVPTLYNRPQVGGIFAINLFVREYLTIWLFLGITSPTVKVQMVLSAETWHTPPHHFCTLEYLHQGESKIWYSVPSCSKDRFLEVVKAELSGEIGHMKDRMVRCRWSNFVTYRKQEPRRLNRIS